ncbi:hypothetical protein LIER_02539 [Lithospermum erythrorhizon]|uniref:Uncharacterized protein n=1 Tax=Lithospermum erythrorhizon TaxID=34254 RepID=A0AAV3NPX0_LITER
MCTDFTNLNKACPKDYFPLRRLIDGSAGYEVFDFIDVSWGITKYSWKKLIKKKRPLLHSMCYIAGL